MWALTVAWALVCFVLGLWLGLTDTGVPCEQLRSQTEFMLRRAEMRADSCEATLRDCRNTDGLIGNEYGAP
jgi:hypothetical protein